MIRAALFLCFGLVLAACNAVPLADTPTRAKITDSTLPPMKAFATPAPSAPGRSNANIAADFLSLHFQLESGRKLEVFTRFEMPITVRVTGSPPPSLEPDLRRLLVRLRREAGIDIRQITSGAANITIEAVSRTEIRRALPQAACFVVPNVSSFDDWMFQVRRQEAHSLGLSTMFVPLFRIERIFLDEQIGEVESYRQRFEQQVGVAVETCLGLETGSGEEPS